MKKVYLDHNATTPLDPEVKAAMLPYLETSWVGNASSLHWAGEAAKQALETAREQVAELINALPKELTFTSGATESINSVLKGLFHPTRRKKNHLIISAVEHQAVLDCAETLASWGVEVDVIAVDSNGQIDPAQLKALLRADTGLVSLQWANNEIGTVYPVDEFVALAHEAGVPIHLDAAQALGKLAVDVRRVPLDFLTFSAHKIYGPQGVGLTFTRHGRTLLRFIDGGDQERKRRGGTENIADIVGLGKAAEIARYRLTDDRQHASTLRDYLESGLRQHFPDIIIHGENQQRLGNTSNVRFPGLESESLLIALDLQGIAVSSGSACASGAIEPSHVLLAMGCTTAQAKSAIRFSLGRGNSKADLDYVLSVLPALIQQLQAA